MRPSFAALESYAATLNVALPLRQLVAEFLPGVRRTGSGQERRGCGEVDGDRGQTRSDGEWSADVVAVRSALYRVAPMRATMCFRPFGPLPTTAPLSSSSSLASAAAAETPKGASKSHRAPTSDDGDVAPSVLVEKSESLVATAVTEVLRRYGEPADDQPRDTRLLYTDDSDGDDDSDVEEESDLGE